MAARISALLPRIAALTVIWLLAASAITFAAAGRGTTAPPVAAPAAAPAQVILVVPDVRHQAYVFAKGILEDGGFGWRVEGGVQGYAANTVASQSPAPGTQVVDTGLPTIILHLAVNPAYPQKGLPENRSPRAGTAILLASQAAVEPTDGDDATTPPPATPPPAPSKKKPTKAAPPKTTVNKPRKPAFLVAGAPAEPLDEMPLPQRARLLGQRLASHEKPTPELVNYWLYQHSWIVTGANFGWSGGAEALRILIGVDTSLQARWGSGAKSAAVARAALADVERRQAG
jgi:hypothetical protein